MRRLLPEDTCPSKALWEHLQTLGWAAHLNFSGACDWGQGSMQQPSPLTDTCCCSKGTAPSQAAACYSSSRCRAAYLDIPQKPASPSAGALA